MNLMWLRTFREWNFKEKKKSIYSESANFINNIILWESIDLARNEENRKDHKIQRPTREPAKKNSLQEKEQRRLIESFF